MSKVYEILIADDDAKPFAIYLDSLLEEENANISYATSPKACRDYVSLKRFDLIFLDIHFAPDQEKGTDLIPTIRALNPNAKICMLSGDDRSATLQKSIQLGAADFISKSSMGLDGIAAMIKNFIRADRGHELDITEGKKLAQCMGISFTSPKMDKVFAQAAIARRNPHLDVLITGETGAGKENIARAINLGLNRPFVVMNSATIVQSLAESQLFGHRRGAFTGSTGDHAGNFAAANGGDIFLDEVGDLPLDVQAKLLRCLQFKEITPLGSNKTIKLDFRVIAATNKDLESMVREGTFREDLLERLKGTWIEVPPLRDRSEDVEPLLSHFIKKSAKPHLTIAATCLNLLKLYPWPGNVRELEKFVEEVVAAPTSHEISLVHVPPHFKRKLIGRYELSDAPVTSETTLVEVPLTATFDEAINRFSKIYLTRRMEILGGKLSKRKLAHDLDIARSTIDDYERKFQLNFQRATS